MQSFMHRKLRDWKWFSNSELVEGGRILIIWNENLVDYTPLETTEQVIHCRILDKITSKSFICSFVYGFNLVATRRDLWSNMISWGINSAEPWILLGDFNNTLSLIDRMDGIQIANSDQEEFLACATTLGLQDAFSLGHQYTLSNGTHWAKLDRVLHNSSWSSLKLDCQADFLPYYTLSDHTTMVVSLTIQVQTRNKPFKFLNMRMEHPCFTNILLRSHGILLFLDPNSLSFA